MGKLIVLLIRIWLPGDLSEPWKTETYSFDTWEQCEKAAQDYAAEAKRIMELGGNVQWSCTEMVDIKELMV